MLSPPFRRKVFKMFAHSFGLLLSVLMCEQLAVTVASSMSDEDKVDPTF